MALVIEILTEEDIAAYVEGRAREELRHAVDQARLQDPRVARCIARLAARADRWERGPDGL